MVHAFHLAGVPPGLIQCVTGKGSEIGDYMTTHPGADCISFTGTTLLLLLFALAAAELVSAVRTTGNV